MAVFFVFLDGVGLAPAGLDNPLTTAPTPFLYHLLGGPLVLETASDFFAPFSVEKPVLLKAIDATLGVAGLPQSGTGQTALLAGLNAAALHGRHQPHAPPVSLRPLLAEQNVLRQVIAAGGHATCANAFTAGYWQALAQRRIRLTASVIAAQGAGLRFRTLDDLRRGEAVAWDITGAALQARGEDIGLISPEAAGTALVRLGTDHDLVFYENFLPDLAGHGRVSLDIHAVFALIDAFLAAAIANLRPNDTLLMTSDHGNIESVSAPTHTRNPVPLLVVGAGVAHFEQVHDISQIAAAILDSMNHSM